MEKGIIEKLERFVLLSSEFTICTEAAYEGFVESYHTPAVSSNIGYYVTAEYKSCSEHKKEKSKIEKYKDKLEDKFNKAERYEEYLQLKTDLSNYFEAAKKLK